MSSRLANRLPNKGITAMQTFDTPGPIVASIEVGAGHIRINASDRSDTVVAVRPTNEADDNDVQAANETRVDYANGQLSVAAPRKHWRSWIGRPPSIDVVVDLPSGSEVSVKAAAGDIRSEGRLGECRVETAAGSVRLDETGRLKARSHAGDVLVTRAIGHADVSTSSGNIRVTKVEGSAVAKTSNGGITLGEVSGDARMNTANGDITVERALSTVGAKTAFGNIRVGEVVRGSIVLETGFGELELGIREGTAAWLDVNSGFGAVRSHLDAADEPGPTEEKVKVRARTSYGDIVIHRATAVMEDES